MKDVCLYSKLSRAEGGKNSKLNFAPRRETCPVPAQYQIFTVKTSKMEGMNIDKLWIFEPKSETSTGQVKFKKHIKEDK